MPHAPPAPVTRIPHPAALPGPVSPARSGRSWGPFGAAITFHRPSTLDAPTRDEIWRLASTAIRTTPTWFFAQLARYDEVILYRERASGRLVGTTGLRVLDRTVAGVPLRILYTGAVTLDAEWRGRGLVPRAGLHTLARHGRLGRRMYWLMETDSWRAYALAVGTLPHTWPRPGDRGDPALYDALCADVFGADWDPDRRICRPLVERRLHPELARIPASALASNPHARAYAALNPGHEDGDALPVLTHLGLANLGHIVAGALAKVGHRRR